MQRARSISRGLPKATSIGRSGVVLATLVLPFLMGDACDGPAPPPAAPLADTAPDDVRTIENFVECLNNRAVGGDIADAVQCLPRGCTLTLTKSGGSAQPACSFGDCQLPRVLVNCPGPPQLQPSFSLCVTDGGLDRVEIGQTINTEGHMRMADVHVGPNYQVTDPGSVVSKVTDDTAGSETDSAGCWVCHQAPPVPPVGQEAISKPEPYEIFGVNCVIDTDEPCQPADAGNCNGSEEVTAQTLDEVCNCIQAGTIQDGHPLDTDEGRRALELCQNLVAYRDTRGICGSDGPPIPVGPNCEDLGEDCNPYDDGATSATPTGYTCQEVDTELWQCVSPRACAQYELSGGGKLLNEGGVSFARVQVSGQTGISGNGEVCDYTDVFAEIETFNHAANLLTNSVELSSFSATDVGGGDFSAQGDGTALVNGAGPANVTFSAGKNSGTVSFQLDDLDTPQSLAGATGETGRADFGLTVSTER
jgi:hypothetical protein